MNEFVTTEQRRLIRYLAICLIRLLQLSQRVKRYIRVDALVQWFEVNIHLLVMQHVI